MNEFMYCEILHGISTMIAIRHVIVMRDTMKNNENHFKGNLLLLTDLLSFNNKSSEMFVYSKEIMEVHSECLINGYLLI
jgi:hypothetical protein